MATDDFTQRLDRIEAVLPTLATKGDLADLRAELRQEMHDDLVRELASVATNINDLRGEVRVASAMLRQLVGAVAGITELLQALSAQGAQLGDRIRRIEDRA